MFSILVYICWIHLCNIWWRYSCVMLILVLCVEVLLAISFCVWCVAVIHYFFGARMSLWGLSISEILLCILLMHLQFVAVCNLVFTDIFFTTTCLHTHSWLNWVDEDDEDEVDLKEKPEDTKIHQQYYIKIRPEAPGVWAKYLINVIKDLIIAIIGTADSEKCMCVKPEGLFSRNTCETSYSNSRWILWLHSCILHALWLIPENYSLQHENCLLRSANMLVNWNEWSHKYIIITINRGFSQRCWPITQHQSVTYLWRKCGNQKYEADIWPNMRDHSSVIMWRYVVTRCNHTLLFLLKKDQS